VVGLLAGGSSALVQAGEEAEDDPESGAADIANLEVGPLDLVVGIATSGRTPYVRGAIREARRRRAATIGLTCNRPSLLGGEVDLEIAPLVGAEIISGSTRLKAGTATKLVLNMISTGAMVQIGKTLGNRMVDLQPSCEKLRIRSRRILRELGGVDDTLARDILARCSGCLKQALVVALADVEPDTAQSLLETHNGQVRAAVKSAGGRDPR
jgi:N-acetylmuramic acid 6-phosphate etherase